LYVAEAALNAEAEAWGSKRSDKNYGGGLIPATTKGKSKQAVLG